jgi:GT2 family glycosyltransferase
MSRVLTHVQPPAANNGEAHQLSVGLAVVVCTYKRSASLKRFLDSLAAQHRMPEQLIVVDASPDDDTEHMVRSYVGFDALAADVQYVHVAEPYVGLTRQRNFAMRLVRTELLAFFDDDITFLPGCLAEMERVHRAYGDQVVGVGARVRNLTPRATWRWRLRLLFRVISRLQPGVYQRSGISIPWRFLEATSGVTEGDFLPGCAMMWKTQVAREVGFHEAFRGYGLGEDLDFSLRAGRHGKIMMAGDALVEHLSDPAGRPDSYRLGYMAVRYRYRIHQRGLPDRTWKDAAWFAYALLVDTALEIRHFVYPSRWGFAIENLAGRLRGAYDLLRDR